MDVSCGAGGALAEAGGGVVVGAGVGVAVGVVVGIGVGCGVGASLLYGAGFDGLNTVHVGEGDGEGVGWFPGVLGASLEGAGEAGPASTFTAPALGCPMPPLK